MRTTELQRCSTEWVEFLSLEDSEDVVQKARCKLYAGQERTKYRFLGLCYGLQCAVIEFARNVCGQTDAISAEWIEEGEVPSLDNVYVGLMDSQQKVTIKGGSMRLGAFACELEKGSKAYKYYDGRDVVRERHRHRFEVNPSKTEILEKNGMIISGRNPDSRLVEIIELPDHPFFVATQAHPEFKSRPTKAHPLFIGFITEAFKLAGKEL